MIVARWKVCSWLVRRSEKSNYTHWLTYYTNIRINLVFLVRTIMFQSECRLFAMLHLVSSFNHWFFKIFYPFSCMPAICTLEFRLQFRSILFCLSLFLFLPLILFFSVCVFLLSGKITQWTNKRQIGGNMWLIEVLSATERREKNNELELPFDGYVRRFFFRSSNREWECLPKMEDAKRTESIDESEIHNQPNENNPIYFQS